MKEWADTWFPYKYANPLEYSREKMATLFCIDRNLDERLSIAYSFDRDRGRELEPRFPGILLDAQMAIKNGPFFVACNEKITEIKGSNRYLIAVQDSWKRFVRIWEVAHDDLQALPHVSQCSDFFYCEDDSVVEVARSASWVRAILYPHMPQLLSYSDRSKLESTYVDYHPESILAFPTQVTPVTYGADAWIHKYYGDHPEYIELTSDNPHSSSEIITIQPYTLSAQFGAITYKTDTAKIILESYQVAKPHASLSEDKLYSWLPYLRIQSQIPGFEYPITLLTSKDPQRPTLEVAYKRRKRPGVILWRSDMAKTFQVLADVDVEIILLNCREKTENHKLVALHIKSAKIVPYGYDIAWMGTEIHLGDFLK